MSSPKSHALTLIAQTQIPTTGGNLIDLQAATLKQLDLIKKLEGEAAFRAILTGIGLHQIKASLSHGKFGPWLEKNSQGGRAQCGYYMKLALTFLEETKATKPEMLLLAAGKFELSTDDVNGRRFVKRIADFVGDLSLNELLIKHDIKGVGMKSSLASASQGEDSDGQTTFNFAVECMYNFRTQFLKAEAVIQTDPKHLRQILEEHDAQNATLHKLCDAVLGKKKA